MVGKMKKIVMWFSTSSRVSWLQVWKQVHLWHPLLFSTCWWWEVTQCEIEKRRYSRNSCYCEKEKRSKAVYLKIQIQWILFYGKLENWDWTLRRGTPWNSQDAPGTKLKFGKKKQSGGIIQKGELHERNPCAPGFDEQPPEETSRQEDCTSKAAWKLAKKCKLKAEDNYVLFSYEGARDTEDRMFDMDSGASMHNAEQGEFELRYNGYFEKVQNPMSDLPRPGQCK